MNLKLGPDERLPLYQRLRDEMLAKISIGEWLPGKPIPTEAELTKSYGVAIGTVRKAVDTLVSEGLLQRSQGRGTFVRRPNFDASFFRFFRQVTASGSQKVPESRILSRTLEQPPESVAKALSLQKDEQALLLERVRVIDGHSVFREQIWLPSSKFSSLLEIDPSLFGNLLYPFYEEQCGQLVASARETLTIESANAEIADVIGISEGKPVVVIERIALGYDRTPIEYRISRGAAEGFRYQIDIS